MIDVKWYSVKEKREIYRAARKKTTKRRNLLQYIFLYFYKKKIYIFLYFYNE